MVAVPAADSVSILCFGAVERLVGPMNHVVLVADEKAGRARARSPRSSAPTRAHAADDGSRRAARDSAGAGRPGDPLSPDAVPRRGAESSSLPRADVTAARFFGRQEIRPDAFADRKPRT